MGKALQECKLPGRVRKGSFWWKDVLKLLSTFKDMASVQVKIGNTCFFWQDRWRPQSMKEMFPQAYSFAKNKQASVSKAFEEQEFTNLFTLPLSQLAFDQVLSIQQLMELTPLDDHSKDVWAYPGGSTLFKPTAAYKLLSDHHHVNSTFKWLWRSFCQPKHKVFF